MLYVLLFFTAHTFLLYFVIWFSNLHVLGCCMPLDAEGISPDELYTGKFYVFRSQLSIFFLLTVLLLWALWIVVCLIFWRAYQILWLKSWLLLGYMYVYVPNSFWVLGHKFDNMFCIFRLQIFGHSCFETFN